MSLSSLVLKIKYFLPKISSVSSESFQELIKWGWGLNEDHELSSFATISLEWKTVA